MRDPISASRESIKFRFKTNVANGVLMYSRGTQGDYVALQLRDNRMLLNIDLGGKVIVTHSHSDYTMFLMFWRYCNLLQGKVTDSRPRLWHHAMGVMRKDYQQNC
jgi:hypothetical protein